LVSVMPLVQAVIFIAAAVVLVVATQSQRLHPFLALLVVAAGFGLAGGFSVGLLGKAFGAGFSQTIYSPGLVIAGAALIAALAERRGVVDWITASIADGQRWRRGAMSALAGMIAGSGAFPATAFAVLSPLLSGVGDGPTAARPPTSITAALAISASHGLILFSPVPIAAASILGARWDRVALFGLPIALVLAIFGMFWARWFSPAGVAKPPASDFRPVERGEGKWSTIVLLLAVTVPLPLLIIQSLGDIPSEPLGGGADRERILGLGRPLILFLTGVGIMIAGHWRLSLKLLADAAWTEDVFAKIAGLLLTIGAAGGLQKLCQETGMAELIGERIAGVPGGLMIPFLVAAMIKTLQGSSLVAAITTAGMIQPSLASLGLDAESGRALATLAIGAGAMTVSHVNDEYFWLVTWNAGLAPARGLTALSLGTLVQGLGALALLAMTSFIV
jgi:gluconate:H+ symporter, GntP family